MNTVALAFPGWKRLLWAGRLRAMFSGFGFAMSVALAILVLWSLEEVLSRGPGLGAAEALRVFSSYALSILVPVFTNTLLLLVVLNLAPAGRLARGLWFVATPIAMAAWCNIYVSTAESTVTLADAVSGFLNASLFAAAVAYRGWTRTAEQTLQQQVLESATLETEVRRAQLQMLRAQIEPHFLFNTLATVLTLSRVDRDAALAMLDHLLRYFAETLPKLRRDESSLAEEAELIDAYLRIHQIRFGNRLAYELTVPEELAGIRVPTMMLLTLVENAVKHGIGPSVDGGFIRVSAARDGSRLTLRVADSGRGMTVQHGHGSGLANVRQRLLMLYGDDGVLALAPGESRGVVATIAMPMQA